MTREPSRNDPAIRPSPVVLALALSVAVVLCNAPLVAQPQQFDSGSTGSDGALVLTEPGIFNFDPDSFDPPLDPESDNIYHFTNITIGAGVVVRISGSVINGPIYWLASGDVNITGAIDLSGRNGHNPTSSASLRVPSEPGPGGYSGGVGGNLTTPMLPRDGNGPGGGAAATVAAKAQDGRFSGNDFLIPLVGGSGGGGAKPSGCFGQTIGGGGGAGGGAILIASSTQILFAGGRIDANGGTGLNCGDSFAQPGRGSGGAIRLVSNAINVNVSGFLSVRCGSGGCNDDRDGIVRLEAFQIGPLSDETNRWFKSVPFRLILPETPPSSIMVTSIAGMPVNANPFSFPDVTINSLDPVAVVITAKFIPLGTTPQLFIFSEDQPDQVVVAPVLEGTLEESTSTLMIPFPPGGSRGFVKAIWN